MYKKARFYFRLIFAFISKYFFTILFGMVLSLIFSLSLPKLLQFLPKSGYITRVGLIGRYTLDDLPRPILQKISLGLTTVDSTGQAGSGLSESWQVSADGKTFTFNLKPNLFWQDGKKITSQDFHYELKGAQVTYPEPSKIVIKLQEPFAPLPIFLSRPVLKIIPGSFLKPNQIIGAGNFRISDIKMNGTQLSFLEIQSLNASSIPHTIRYYFYSSVSQAITAFKLGLLDSIDSLNTAQGLEDWPNASLVTTTLNNRYLGLFFNTQSATFSGQSGKTFRTALAYAINKNRWENKAISPINPGSWAYNSDVKKYEFDLTRAAALLKNVEVIPSSITLTTLPNYLDIAQSIKSDWEKLRLTVNISITPEIPVDFQVLLIAQAIPIDPDQYNLWHSTQDTTNLTKINNPRIDKLLEDGRKTYKPEERKKFYFDFQKYLSEEIPVIFLFYPNTYSVYRK